MACCDMTSRLRPFNTLAISAVRSARKQIRQRKSHVRFGSVRGRVARFRRNFALLKIRSMQKSGGS